MTTGQTASARQRINLRPTLILGLGGTGYRIAVQLKARLEEQLGASSNYSRVIKFLVFDTANENFTASQPNYPDRPPVGLLPDSEFVRISDVPLHDLARSKETNAAIANIFPEVLHTTQIDQGAQQIRRLGRIALFFHYGKTVKPRITQAVNALRHIDNRGYLGTTPDGRELYTTDHNRLRVFLLCSICGGTGSGTFIDMAYLVKHIAVGAGLSSPRACDVIGMLLLPEAFPEVVTTGADRIRANAYAALLDLEYFNQATSVDEKLYEVQLPRDHIAVNGGPFSLCYLINGSGPTGTLQGMRDLAPVLGDALSLMIQNRTGEQLDATLDNIRSSLALHYEGYRAFYSTLGIAQIAYPADWLKRNFTLALRRAIIDTFIAPRQEQAAHITTAGVEAEKWFTDQRNQAANVLNENLDRRQIVRNLRMLKPQLSVSTTLTTDLETAYQQDLAYFRQRIVRQIQDNLAAAQQQLEDALAKAVVEHVNAGIKTTEPCGLQWTEAWLRDLERQINESQAGTMFIDHRAKLRDEIDIVSQQENLPLAGTYMARRRAETACENLMNYLIGEAITAETNRAVRDLLLNLREAIERQRRSINRAVGFWRRLSEAQTESSPQYSRVTDMIFQYDTQDVKQGLDQEIMRMVHAILPPNGNGEKTKRDNLISDLHANSKQAGEATGNNNAAFPLAHALNPAQFAALEARLNQFCAARFEVAAAQTRVVGSDTPTELTAEQASDALTLLKRLGERGQTQWETMRNKAEPWLVYSRGILQGLPPREIKVLGLENEGRQDQVSDLGSDVAYVSTYDPTRISFLVTHHGIPALALSKFEDYRKHYDRLVAEGNIFHLDNKLENAPYDPGSAYFVSLNDLLMDFARALAYGWIVRVPNGAPGVLPANVFGFEPSFFMTFMEQVQTRRQELAAQVAKLKADGEVKNITEDKPDKAKTVEQRLARRSLQIWHQSLEWLDRYNKALYTSGKEPKEDAAPSERLAALRALKDIPAFTPHRDYHQCAHFIALPLLPVDPGPTPLTWPNTLLEARDALCDDKTREIPALFQQAVRSHYEQPPGQQTARSAQEKQALDRRVTAFLQNQNAQADNQQDEADNNTLLIKLSERHEPSHALELQLRALLNAYQRAVNKQLWSLRLSESAGYLDWSTTEDGGR